MRRSTEQERRHRARKALNTSSIKCKHKNNTHKNKEMKNDNNKLHYMPLSCAAGPRPLVPTGLPSAGGVTVMCRLPRPSVLQETAVRLEKRRRRRRRKKLVGVRGSWVHHTEGVSCAARVAAGSIWSKWRSV